MGIKKVKVVQVAAKVAADKREKVVKKAKVVQVAKEDQEDQAEKAKVVQVEKEVHLGVRKAHHQEADVDRVASEEE